MCASKLVKINTSDECQLMVTNESIHQPEETRAGDANHQSKVMSTTVL